MNPPVTGPVVRLFVALELEPTLVAALVGVQQRLQEQLPRRVVRWARPEQLHLTLCFLGNVAVARLPALEAALREAVAGLAAPRLTLTGAGGFPDPQRPRVLWVGIGGDLAALGLLQARAAAAVAGFGEHREVRGFQPHLTVGRLGVSDTGAVRVVGAALAAVAVGLLGEWCPTELHVIQSQLSPAGARYTELAVVVLGSVGSRSEAGPGLLPPNDHEPAGGARAAHTPGLPGTPPALG